MAGSTLGIRDGIAATVPVAHAAAVSTPPHVTTGNKKHAYVPWTPQQSYLFVSSGGYSFTVLAGAGAPTIKGGFAKIQVIDRPRRVGFTMPVGYDPISMDVPIQFECSVVANQPADAYSPADIERDIQILEGMAGRGGSVSVDGSIVSAVGDPPTLRIYSNQPDNQSNLIPPNVQNLQWVISSLTYDTNPVRGPGGDRRRQMVTVTLSQWIAPPSAIRVGTSTYQVVYSTLAVDTVAKIVRKYTSKHDAASYRTVISFSRSHGATYRSYTQKLPAGTAVYIPRDL